MNAVFFIVIKRKVSNYLLTSAIDYYHDKLICWYEAEYGRQIDTYSDTNLKIIASFYSFEKMQHQYGAGIAEMWGALDIPDETQMGGLDFSDTQWDLAIIRKQLGPIYGTYSI